MKTTWGVSFQIQWRAAAAAADSTRGCLDQPLYYQKSSVEAALKTKGFYQLPFFLWKTLTSGRTRNRARRGRLGLLIVWVHGGTRTGDKWQMAYVASARSVVKYTRECPF